jgi:ATP phosphoribosyltransferase regulatory subunit
VVLGDQAVFEAVVAACGLPAGWQKRLVHAFGNQAQLQRLMADLSDPARDGVFGPEVERLAILGKLDDEATLVAHIDATMEATGYSTNASRSPADIARRLREKMELANTRLDDRTLALLREFLALELSLAEGPGRTRRLRAKGRPFARRGTRPLRKPRGGAARHRCRSRDGHLPRRLRPSPRLLHRPRLRDHAGR